MSWLLLVAAIVLEIAGTMSMKFSEGFSKPLPSALVFVFYGLSIGTLTLALRQIEVSVAYAVWSGMGVALVATLGMLIFEEQITTAKVGALGLIIAGVVMLNLLGEAQ